MEQGKVTEVTVAYAQAEVTDAAAIGATVVYLADVSDFDEGGGQVQIGDVIYDYVTITDLDDETDDEPASSISLATGLTVALEPSDKVYLYPLTEEKYATVSTQAADDALRCRIPQSLQPQFADGVREEYDQESVWIELDPDRGWYVKDVAATSRVLGSMVDPVGLPQGNDGVPPSYAPTVRLIGSIKAILAAVDPIANADPVDYEYHISDASGVITPGDAATMVHVGPETGFLIRRLANGTDLVAGTDYYIHVVAKDADGYGPVSAEYSSTPVQINSPDIAANSIIGDMIVGNEVTADKLAAVLALLSELYVGSNISIKPADSAPGAADSGIKITLSNGGYIHFPSDGSAAELIKVIARFTKVTVEDNMEILGVNNRVGGALTLDKNIPPPANQPTVTSVQDPSSSLPLGTAGVGLGDSNGSWEVAKRTAQSSVFEGVGSGTNDFNVETTIYAIDKASGASTVRSAVSVLLFMSSSNTTVATPTPTLVSFHSSGTKAVWMYYCPAFSDGTGFNVPGQSWNSLAKYIIVTYDYSTGTPSVWLWPGAVANYYFPAVFTDGAYVYVGASFKSDGHLGVWRYNMDGSGGVNSLATGVYTKRDMTGLYVGNADYGALRYIFTFGGALPGSAGVVVHDGANFKDATTEAWSGPSSESIKGIVYSAGRFWTNTSANTIRRFSTIKTATARAVKYAWHNIAGNIKSTASPVKNGTQSARGWLKVDTDTIPASSDPQAPDSVLVYVAAHEQAALAAGLTSATYEVPTTTGGDSPAVDGFAAISTYGLVQSEAIDSLSKPLVDIRGTGDGRVGPYHWTSEELPAGSMSKSSAQSGSTTSTMMNFNSTRKLTGGVVLSANGMLQVPRDGWYQINANCTFASSTSSARRILGIGSNSDGSATVFTSLIASSIASAQDAANISILSTGTCVYLTAGTYIGAWINTGVAYALDVSQTYFNNLSVVYLGGG